MLDVVLTIVPYLVIILLVDVFLIIVPPVLIFIIKVDVIAIFMTDVYQYNSTILQVPAAFLRPLFGWKPVHSFSATEDERLRREASVSLP